MEGVNFNPFGRDEMEEEDINWDDLDKDLKRRLHELRQFNSRLETSSCEDYGNTSIKKNCIKEDTIELVANQIYNKIAKIISGRRKRLGIKGGNEIFESNRQYVSFNTDNDGNLTFVCKNKVIDFDNIEEGLDSPSKMISKLGVNKLRLMGFMDITDVDVKPYKQRHVEKREKLRELGITLNERSKAISSTSTMDTETIEMVDMTSKDIDDAEQDMSFIKDGGSKFTFRELKGLDKQLRTTRGSLRAAMSKRIKLEGRIKHEENKLNEIQDPTYSDDQRKMVEDRIKKLRDELDMRNEEINILKGEASKQINQIRDSITKFLDNKTGTLGERVRTLFREQGITIASILTAVGITIGVLIEALLPGGGGTGSASAASGGGEPPPKMTQA